MTIPDAVLAKYVGEKPDFSLNQFKIDLFNYLTTNMFERAEGEKISIISSERYAKKFLPRAYDIGFLRDETGVTFPMCNLHKAFVEPQ